MSSSPTLPPELIERLREVRSVGVITGAGISAESGIPTYRGQGGIYDDPAEGDRTVEALTGTVFQRDPDRTWRVLAGLARTAQDAKPNAGHRAIAEIEKSVDQFVLLTQNVDGLHREAGSENIIEIHGNIFFTRCLECSKGADLTAEVLRDLDGAPRCQDCEGVLRPEVVLFEEMLPVMEVRRLQSHFYEEMPDFVLTVGTSALFPYILEPVYVARQSGKLTAEINPERTDVSGVVDFWLEGKAGDWLPRIAETLASFSDSRS